MTSSDKSTQRIKNIKITNPVYSRYKGGVNITIAFIAQWELYSYLTVDELTEDHDTFAIDEIGITGDERDRRSGSRLHHAYIRGADDAHTSYAVPVFLHGGLDEDFIAGLQFIQVAEQLSKDIVVCRKHHISTAARVR